MPHARLQNRLFEDYDVAAFNSAGMDFFVIIGSIAAFIGPASQSNYAGVRSFQDAFARFRRARGEHCVTVDLGAVEGIGYIVEWIAAARSVDMMFVDHKVLRKGDVHLVLKWACNPRLSTPASPWAAQVVAGLTRTQAAAAAVVTHLFAKRLARSLAVPVADIDVGRPAYAFGVDSLVAVELLFWFSSDVRADVPFVQILGSSTIAQLGAVAAAKSEHLQGRDLPA
ncbi:putative secondary metabolism biosynthetic enzyme [Cytospora paraplurivora]|uniref:Secondary metabolism biosynthetic enzyme n=1 Tax=Cytospora paraplurivora TaxID=2898453 RepID=A0AAN9YM88_9PEZI